MFMKGDSPDNDDERFDVFSHPWGHKDLPPAYFYVCGLDLLQDEAITYEKILREDCGIKTNFDMYFGLPHSFWSFFPALKSSVVCRKDILKGVGWLLGKKPDLEKLTQTQRCLLLETLPVCHSISVDDQKTISPLTFSAHVS